MGFFPFLAPFTPWVIQVMKDREQNPIDSMLQKNPFVILTSAALVVKSDSNIFDNDIKTRVESIKGILNNTSGVAYKGCIIANNINDIGLSYSANETIVGIDFEGNPIKVINESGRRVSTPIIESIDIDTDGANNTLKTARVQLKCFTLKQLEMFEMFFLKPGMNVLCEWGDSTLKAIYDTNKNKTPNQPVTGKNERYEFYQNGRIEKITTFDNITDALVPKKNYNDFCDNFYKYFKSDKTGQIDYRNRVEASLGSYDLVAGKVLDYSFSVEADGTYNVNMEISQGNQISLAIPHSKPNVQTKQSTPPKDIEYSTSDQIREQIIVDFNIDKATFDKILTSKTPDHKGGWEADWFNFVKVNKEQQDTVASSVAYVSLRFILKILMNYILADGNVDNQFHELIIPKYKIDKSNEEIEIIPVVSHKMMLSSSEEIIFPRKNIPQIVSTKSEKKAKDGTVISTNEESININSDVDGRISNLDFHIENDLSADLDGKFETIKKSPGDNLVIGNALNIFVKYETVVRYWQSTYTRIEFLEKVLQIVNQNGYGLYNLVYGSEIENGQSTVIDARFSPQEAIKETEKESYRFRPTTLQSIVREFSFNFEMSNLVAGRTIFNSGKFLALAKQENPNANVGQLSLPSAAYKAIDNSTFGNADGYYSINNIEFRRIKENFEKAQQSEASGSTVQSADAANPTTTKPAEDLSEVIKSKSINFIIDENATSNKKVVLIYKDQSFLREKIAESEQNKNRPVTSPITVTITVDGFSGFRCGQYFNVDGIPEIYNQIGVFQITNTKHNVSREGWKTTIEADFRIVKKEKVN